MTDFTIKENVHLSAYTTFQLGGPCPGLIECATPEELSRVVQALHARGKTFIVIGEGSNILVADSGLDCLVVRYLSTTPDIHQDQNKIIVSASTLVDDLALWAAQNGLKGLNCLSGIPGTLAGAITGNAGSFGQQISQFVSKIILLKSDGTFQDEDPQALGFSYRHSRIKETREIVAKAEFLLESAPASELLAQREKILALRQEKHPDYRTIPCAGSFFKNIEASSALEDKKAAGWFLEQVGAKQMSVGGAGVFEKHANIIIKKTSQCTAQDVYQLSLLMQRSVKERFGINLEPEVRLAGAFA